MGWIELVLLEKILKKKMKYQRILLSSGLGSMMGCLILRFFSDHDTLRILLIEPVFIVMLMVGYECSVRKALKSSGYAWMIAMISGGAFMVLKQMRLMPWVLIAICSAFCSKAFFWMVKRDHKDSQNSYFEVEFSWNQKTVSICAFLDTGNFLYDPLTHLPVSILEEKTLKRYFNISVKELMMGYQTDKIRVIPYRSVGMENGCMSGILVNDFKIMTEEQKIEIPQAIIAISKNSLSRWGHYEMLLHPDLIKNGRS